MRAPSLVACALAALLAGASPRQDRPPLAQQVAPARDSASQARADGVIRGQVTLQGGNQPLHRVRIALSGSVQDLPAATTDVNGEFEFTEVPPGAYSVTASRPGFLTRQYGQRIPREAGRTVTIASGQVVDGIDFALSRGAVLAGRIGDDLGDPLPGARVEAVELRYIRGRRVAVPARIAITDDQGEFRLGGLEAGTYQLRASSADVWEGDDGQSTYTFGVTYFPGVSSADRPTTVKVGDGEQIPGLDFRLIVGHAPRISGTLLDANGSPLSGQVVHLSVITRTLGGALMSSGPGGDAKTDQRGAFDFPKLAPGEYLVIAGGPNDRTTATVVVDRDDAKQVTVTPQRPVSAAGTIVSDEETPLSFSASGVRVTSIPTDPASILPAWGGPSAQTPKADWTFRIPNLNGDYLFRVTGLPDEWMLKSVLLGGRQVTDTPVRVAAGGPDVAGLQLVLSRQGGTLAGEVVDRAGDAAPHVTVIAFAEDRALWGVASRFVRAVRPDGRGRFSIAGLPAATFRVAVRDGVVEGQWEDPEFLEGLVERSTRVKLSEARTETLTLTLEPPR